MSQVREIVEEYRLQRVLNTAGHSTVFQARDPETDRPVVLKLLAPMSMEGGTGRRQRFVEQMEALRTVTCPALPTILDFGFTPDESAFLITSYLEGLELSTLVGAPPARTVALLAQLAGALESLAEAGVGHGNISTGNVLVVRGQSGEQVVLTGLGSTAFLTADGLSALPGQEPETAPAVAPERFASDSVDVLRADLFSVARVVVEVLGCTVSSGSDGTPEVVLPEPLRAGDADELAGSLSRALGRRPDRRDTTPGQLRRALESAAATLMPAAAAGDDAAGMDRTVSLTKVAHKLPPAPSAPEQADATLLVQPPAEAGGPPPVPGGPEAGPPPSGPPADATVVAPPPPEPPPTTDPVSATGKSADDEPTVTSRPPAGAAPVATRPATSAAEQAPPRQRVGLLIGLALGSVALLGAVMVLLPGPGSWSVSEAEPTPAPVAVVETEPTPPPTPVPAAVNPVLLRADQLLAEEDADAARAALNELSPEIVAGFSDEERQLHEELQEVLRESSVEEAADDLRGGLRHGSVQMLRRAVATLSRVDDEEIRAEGLDRDLERARDALRLHRLLWRAHEQGDHLQVLERAAELAAVLPGYSGTAKLREQAASALEVEADRAVAADDLDRAIDLLAALQERWSDRPGVRGQLEDLRRRRSGLESARRQVAAARARGAAGEPEEALRILGSMQPPPVALRDEVGELRGVLEAQLEEMDAAPPTVAMPGDLELEFRKNDALTIPFQVTDDYRVVRVTVFFRSDSAETFRDAEITADADGVYRWQVTPDVHGNEDLYFYVEASDRSDHLGRLGGPHQPIKIDRKKWFQP